MVRYAATGVSSAVSLFRNFSRAGRLKKRLRTSTVVPRGAAISPTGEDGSRLAFDDRSRLGAAFGSPKRQAGDGRDAGQGLAPEAERRDREEIVFALDLARRMADERRFGIVPAHAVAVVADTDERLSPGEEADGDLPRAGVDRVFHELFDHGDRPLDDLARGDLLGESGRRTRILFMRPRSRRRPRRPSRSRSRDRSGP